MFVEKKVRFGFGVVGERGYMLGSVADELRIPKAATTGGMSLSCYESIYDYITKFSECRYEATYSCADQKWRRSECDVASHIARKYVCDGLQPWPRGSARERISRTRTM